MQVFRALTRLLPQRASATLPAEEDASIVSNTLPERWGHSLFWRTFVMMAAVLALSSAGWYISIKTVEVQPRAEQTARQMAMLVNLTRTALIYTEPLNRISLVQVLREEHGIGLRVREHNDRIVPFKHGLIDDRVQQELSTILGPDTIIANAVNGHEGLWIGFTIEGDPYWLQADASRILPLDGRTWLVWITMAAALSLMGAALMAGLLNRPLQHLLHAINKVREGDYAGSRLDEYVSTRELREVNMGFNRMAEQLAVAEQTRAVMLAGISHDLRTPLARLRLETELSVDNEETRNLMVADIEQADNIINKFMDYARPESRHHTTVNVHDVVQTCAYPYLNAEDMQVQVDVSEKLNVKGDEVELVRVISNLIENTRRYGKSPDGIAHVRIAARQDARYVYLTIRDQGAGVDNAVLDRLTQPFFRADAARTSAIGSGLGLAIVSKVIEHMGGKLVLSNHPQGGLQALLQMPRVK